MGYMKDACDHHLTQLSIEDFGALAAEWRERAQHADLTSVRIADALESVHRRRVRAAEVRVRSVGSRARRVCPSTWRHAVARCWTVLNEPIRAPGWMVARHSLTA